MNTATATYEKLCTMLSEPWNDDLRRQSAEQSADIIHRAVAGITPVKDLRKEELTVLAATMNRRLSVRDSLIVEAVGTPDEETTLTIASEPHSPAAARAVANAINHAFKDRNVAVDPWRTAAARELCEAARNAADHDDPQTHAASAYIAWYDDDTNAAAEEAAAALNADSQCTLARLVIGAIGRGIHPEHSRK